MNIAGLPLVAAAALFSTPRYLFEQLVPVLRPPRLLASYRRPEPGEPDRRTKGRTGARARVQARVAWNAGRR